MTRLSWLALFAFSVSSSLALDCYTGSQLHVQNCPSVSCVKQVFGMDTVRYCDGSGVQSVCQAYKISDNCEMVPNVGYICCCSGNLCNSSSLHSFPVLAVIVSMTFVLRFL